MSVKDNESSDENSIMKTLDQNEKYSNYYKHAKGHLDFITDFKKQLLVIHVLFVIGFGGK